MRLRGRARPAGLPAGALAWATTSDGVRVVATRTDLRIGEAGIAWERVERADWNREEDQLRVVESAEWGRPNPTYVLHLTEPGRLLEVLRERVSASVLLQRFVAVSGKGKNARGFRVVGRRSPAGGEVGWFVEYDAGIDPDDPAVLARVRAELEVARTEAGD